MELTSIQKNIGKAPEMGLDPMKVEHIVRDISKFTKEQKLDILLTNSPELLGLIEDLQTHISTFKQYFESSNLSSLVKEKKRHFRLLMNYCMNICFYLMLKAEGKFVKIHPVIKHLVRIRKLLWEQKINEKERQKNKVRKEKEKLKKT